MSSLVPAKRPARTPAGGSSKKPKKGRDLGAQLKDAFGTSDSALFQEQLKALEINHLRPITASTANRYYAAEKYWRAYFEFSLGEEAAKATLLPDAELPKISLMKGFINFCAVNGRSGLKDGKGWAMMTTIKFLSAVLGMRKQFQCKPHDKKEFTQMYNYIQHLGKIDKVISTGRIQKRILREEDHLEADAACIDPRLNIQSNFQRIQVSSILAFLYTHGSRPGSLVENNLYAGHKQCLTWGDLTWLATGWDEGQGMGFHVFIVMRWMKGMRLVEGDTVQTSMRSLRGPHIVQCPLLKMLALGIYQNIFVEPVLEYCIDAGKISKFPMRLTIRPEYKDRPVWVHDKRGDPDYKAPVVTFQGRTDLVKPKETAQKKTAEHPDTYLGPLTYSALSSYVKKISNFLGWKGFTMRSARYGWAGWALENLTPEHAKYLMGHLQNSPLIATTYQAPDRPVDLSGGRFAMGTDLRMSDWHSSVAWDRDESLRSETKIDENYINRIPGLQVLLNAVVVAENAVQAKFDCLSSEVSGEDANEECVAKAKDAWVDFLGAYAAISTGQASKAGQQKVVQLCENPTLDSGSPPLENAQLASSSKDKTETTPQEKAQPSPKEVASKAPPSPKETAEKVLKKCQTFDDRHPFFPLIENDRTNPRLTVLTQYLTMLKVDALRDESICEFCYDDKSLPESARKKTHNCYSDHAWTCSIKHNPEFWRCPVCTEYVAKPPANGNEQEKQIITDLLWEHQKACEERMRTIAALFIQVKLDDDETISEDAELQDVAELETDEALRFQATMAKQFGEKIDPKVVKHIGHADKDEDMPTRLQLFPNCSKLAAHIITHWNDKSKKSVSAIDYDAEFTCGFAECDKVPTMKTSAMLTHLHNVHDYGLLACNIEHKHSPQCYVLPEKNFYYTSGAEVIAEILDRPLARTTVRELRKRSAWVAHAEKIKRLVKSSEDLTEDEYDDDQDQNMPSTSNRKLGKRSVRSKSSKIVLSTDDEDEDNDMANKASTSDRKLRVRKARVYHEEQIEDDERDEDYDD